MIIEQEKGIKIITCLIGKDFEMMCLYERLAKAGFIGVDFPSITYEIFDLMGIPEELRSDDLFDTYDVWSRQMDWIKSEGERENHLIKVHQELSKLREFSSKVDEAKWFLEET